MQNHESLVSYLIYSLCNQTKYAVTFYRLLYNFNFKICFLMQKNVFVVLLCFQ